MTKPTQVWFERLYSNERQMSFAAYEAWLTCELRGLDIDPTWSARTTRTYQYAIDCLHAQLATLSNTNNRRTR